MNFIKILYFISLFFLGILPTMSLGQMEKTSTSESTKVHVVKIYITGLWRMQEFVILRELLFKTGDKVTINELEKSIQRVRNLRTVRFAKYKVTKTTKDTAEIEIEVGEKWAIVPVARVGGGGGSSFYVLGLYDVNFMGQYLELGSQYLNYNNVHGGMAWFRDPRLLDEHQSLTLILSNTGKPQTIYKTKNHPKNHGPTLEMGTFLKRSKEFKVDYLKYLNDWLGLGTSAEIAYFFFPERNLSDQQKNENQKIGFLSPSPQKRLLHSGTIVLGRINTQDYLMEGFELNTTGSYSVKSLYSSNSIAKVTSQLQAYFLFHGNQNFAGRLYAGSASRKSIISQHYIGGVDAIRGFYDGEFQGRHGWISNFEYRIPSIQLPSFVLQHIAFIDAGNAGDSWADILPLSFKTPLSLGSGFRFIVPPVTRFTARLD